MALNEHVGAVDFAYLEDFMAGDKIVVLEVLALFRQQAATWASGLAPASPGWRQVVHTVKGAARGVGAGVLGDACAVAEARGESALPQVLTALAAAVAAVEAYQAAQS